MLQPRAQRHSSWSLQFSDIGPNFALILSSEHCTIKTDDVDLGGALLLLLPALQLVGCPLHVSCLRNPPSVLEAEMGGEGTFGLCFPLHGHWSVCPKTLLWFGAIERRGEESEQDCYLWYTTVRGDGFIAQQGSLLYSSGLYSFLYFPATMQTALSRDRKLGSRVS